MPLSYLAFFKYISNEVMQLQKYLFATTKHYKWQSRALGFHWLQSQRTQKSPGHMLMTQSLSFLMLFFFYRMLKRTWVYVSVCVCARVCLFLSVHTRACTQEAGSPLQSKNPTASHSLDVLGSYINLSKQKRYRGRSWIVGIFLKSGPKDFQDYYSSNCPVN